MQVLNSLQIGHKPFLSIRDLCLIPLNRLLQKSLPIFKLNNLLYKLWGLSIYKYASESLIYFRSWMGNQWMIFYRSGRNGKRNVYHSWKMDISLSMLKSKSWWRYLIHEGAFGILFLKHKKGYYSLILKMKLFTAEQWSNLNILQNIWGSVS